jgi:hypothetical protein
MKRNVMLDAGAALLLLAAAALAQTPAPAAHTPPACQQLRLTDAECRNLAAEQAKENAARAKSARKDPALGKRERGTIRSGDTIIQYRALGN